MAHPSNGEGLPVASLIGTALKSAPKTECDFGFADPAAARAVYLELKARRDDQELLNALRQKRRSGLAAGQIKQVVQLDKQQIERVSMSLSALSNAFVALCDDVVDCLLSTSSETVVGREDVGEQHAAEAVDADFNVAPVGIGVSGHNGGGQ